MSMPIPSVLEGSESTDQLIIQAMEASSVAGPSTTPLAAAPAPRRIYKAKPKVSWYLAPSRRLLSQETRETSVTVEREAPLTSQKTDGMLMYTSTQIPGM